MLPCNVIFHTSKYERLLYVLLVLNIMIVPELGHLGTQTAEIVLKTQKTKLVKLDKADRLSADSGRVEFYLTLNHSL